MSGDYTIVIDDDDFLMDDAIDTIDRYIYKFKINEMSNVAGLAFRTVDEFGRLIGRSMPKTQCFPIGLIWSTFIKLSHRQK